MEYKKEYFDWQKSIGAFGGKANLFKFSEYILEQDKVLDFGCGGGFLLKNIRAKEKLGIEVNEYAREEATKFGINVVSKIEEVPDKWASIIISNHTLEHVKNPFGTLQKLLPKLSIGGKIVFVVPHQKPYEAYIENHPYGHLYTWNPRTLGTLFEFAGFKVIRVDAIRHQWPMPNYIDWYKRLGQKGFDILCKITAHKNRNFQIRIHARRE